MGSMGHLQHDAPRAAEALGLVETYSYLRGASGKRYLFTSVPEESLSDYPGAVAVRTSARRNGRRIVWVGEIDPLGFEHGAAIGRKSRRMETFIHLLAREPDARRAVIRDLRNSVDVATPLRVPREAAE